VVTVLSERALDVRFWRALRAGEIVERHALETLPPPRPPRDHRVLCVKKILVIHWSPLKKKRP
jgi:hypothetical protein